MSAIDRAFLNLSRAVIEDAIEVLASPIGTWATTTYVSRHEKEAARAFFTSPASTLVIFSRMAGFEPQVVQREALARWTE